MSQKLFVFSVLLILASAVAIDPLVSHAQTAWVQANIANPLGRLQAGMFANVRVQMSENAPVLTMPETAITYTAYGQTVFVTETDET